MCESKRVYPSNKIKEVMTKYISLKHPEEPEETIKSLVKITYEQYKTMDIIERQTVMNQMSDYVIEEEEELNTHNTGEEDD